MDLESLDKAIIGEVWTSPDLYSNLESLVSFGSRFAGTESEVRARDFIAAKFRAYGLANVRLDSFEYTGWRRGSCALRVVAPVQQTLDAIALVYSPSTLADGLRAAIVDVGSGTEKEYARHGSLAGKIVLCSSANPEEGPIPHRREKYARAVNGGALAFVYMRHLPGGLYETGSLRPGRLGEIPAVAISYESGFALKRMSERGEVVVSLDVLTKSGPATGYHVIGEVPGQTDEIIVAGGHYDGHDISQGAMDNASGVCLTLELARVFAPRHGQLRRTIRLMGIACEELGVLGSTKYVQAHPDEMGKIAMMVNLDAAVGSGSKGFSYGGLEDVGKLLKRIAKESGYSLRLVEQVVTASDNFPFYMAGVPAISMLAKEPDRALGRGFGHTSLDTLDKVSERDLKECAMVAARVVLRLADERGSLGKHRTPDEIRSILIAQDLEQPLRAQDKWPY